MVRVDARFWLLGAILCGLCLSTPANTTTGGRVQESTQVGTQVSAQISAQISTQLSTPANAAPQADVAAMPNVVLRPLHFTLLLPLQSDSLGNAANAVRAGFLAAYEQEKSGISLTIVETGDLPADTVSNFADAQKGADIMIGPLTRSAATALAQSGTVRVPTITLTQPDSSDGTAILPPLMLAIGLSVEDEARQAANWIAAGKPDGKVLAVCTSSLWQRRAARAFGVKAKLQGVDADTIELGSGGGYLSAADLVQLKKQVQEQKPAALFAALDAAQVRQMRETIGNETPIYGTAQLNPLSLPDWQTTAPMWAMNGVRLLDIPWQLQPDHPAVMVYPKAVVAADQKRSADLERLYALGIDAFRVARMVATQPHKSFEIDGVTGRLAVDFNKNGIRFERQELRAIYRDGKVVPLTDGP